MSLRAAVFPAAGRGTRMLPATKAVPKELLPLGDKPLLQWAAEEALAAGAERLVFVVGEHGALIQRHFAPDPALEAQLEGGGRTTLAAQLRALALPEERVVWVRQDEPLGLGHAVWTARGELGEDPFAVLLPDDFFLPPGTCLPQLAKARADLGQANLVAVQERPLTEVASYGVLEHAEASQGAKGPLVRARTVVEKPPPDKAPSQDCILGRYILGPSVLRALDAQRRGWGGEIQLTDALADAAANTPPLRPAHRGRAL